MSKIIDTVQDLLSLFVNVTCPGYQPHCTQVKFKIKIFTQLQFFNN